MTRFLWLLFACAGTSLVLAEVLPDDRADLLYHSYSGGGITIEGPSVLVRKKFGDSVSATYNHYVDMISGASIDVVTQASPYHEERKQDSLGLEFLHGKSTYSGGYIRSIENDYDARTAYFNASQQMFGDLTTVSMGFTRGWDIVGNSQNPLFKQDVDRRDWQVGLSQVLTRNLLLGANFETTESEGFLNNPYRSVRYIDATSGKGYSYEPEKYPHTHTGNAASVQLKYYLPWRAALDGTYRFYSDTWQIKAHTFRLGYTQPWRSWTFDGRVRYYRQNAADFYSDLFPYQNSQNYLARDRELAQFQSVTVGAGATWEFKPGWAHWISKGTLNISFDRLHIAYDDYRDVRDTACEPACLGAEPLYVLNANVLQAYVSIWY